MLTNKRLFIQAPGGTFTVRNLHLLSTDEQVLSLGEAINSVQKENAKRYVKIENFSLV